MITKLLRFLLLCFFPDDGSSGQHHVRRQILSEAKLLNPMATNPPSLSISPSKPESLLHLPRS
ncbi:unnamed protein product [Arabidopsis halleri]